MTAVRVYCRVSSTGQEDNYSLETQEAACRAWASDRGYTVASVAREVRSGGDRYRPDLDAIIDSLAPGEIFLSYALDRFSRNMTDTAILIDRMEQAGATLQLVTEDFENSTTGQFLRQAKSFVAQLELEKITERTSRGKRARVASGKPLVGARPRYGYQWNAEKTRYLLDPVAAPIVRMIFDWALAGDSLRGIETRLRERGILSPYGAPTWSRSKIRDLLLCPTYAGNVIAYRNRFEKGRNGVYKQRPARPDEMVLVPGIADAIVTEAEQAEVTARLAHNKAHATRNNRNPEAALLRAGFVFCGGCGNAAQTRNARASRPNETATYLTCRECGSARVSAPDLDAAVWSRVSAILLNPGIIAAQLAKHRGDGGLARDLAALDKRLERNATQLGNLSRAIAALEDASPVIDQMNALSAARKTLQADRDALERRIADSAADAVKVRTLTDWAGHVAQRLDSLTYDEKRLALEALGVRVTATPKDDGENSAPQWEMSMQPLESAGLFVFRSTSAAATVPVPVLPRGRRSVRQGRR